MKKLLLLSFLVLFGIVFTYAQDKAKVADIKFETTTHDFGEVSTGKPVVKCAFEFTNAGTAPLVINQAIASCGCTVPSYTKQPVMPGEKGKIEVTFNATGRPADYFKKSIIVRTNAKDVRLYIKGRIVESKK